MIVFFDEKIKQTLIGLPCLIAQQALLHSG
jgi:hypothetical protein